MGWAEAAASAVAGERQRGIPLPLIGMQLTWFAKQAVTTGFLGRLGDLELYAGTLDFSFANATGFTVLARWTPSAATRTAPGTWPCSGQDAVHGHRHAPRSPPPSPLLWLHVDAVLLRVFGQQLDISVVERRYVVCRVPPSGPRRRLLPRTSQGVPELAGGDAPHALLLRLGARRSPRTSRSPRGCQEPGVSRASPPPSGSACRAASRASKLVLRDPGDLVLLPDARRARAVR
jgi:hypothetical protein